MKYFRIYKKLISNSLMLLLSHRFNLFMSIVASITWTIGQLISLQFLFGRIGVYENWGFGDMVMLLGFGQVFFYSLSVIYYNNFTGLGIKVVNGELDRILTKPINLKFILSFENFSIAQIVPLVTTVIPLIIYGASQTQEFSSIQIIQMFFLVILSTVLLYFFSLAVVSLSFFIEDGSKLWEVIIASSADFNRIPLDILSRNVQGILTFIIPMAFVGFYPLAITKGLYNFWTIFALEILLLVFWIIISKLAWKAGLKRYSSAN